MRQVWVTKSIDAVTAGGHRSRCWERLCLQWPLPQSMSLFCTWLSQWICNDCADFWIRDGGRQVVMATVRSECDSNDGCGAGYTTTHWLCLWGAAGCWCVTPSCTWRCGERNYQPTRCSRNSGRLRWIDIRHTRIVQRRWRGGVLTLNCTGNGTLS